MKVIFLHFTKTCCRKFCKDIQRVLSFSKSFLQKCSRNKIISIIEKHTGKKSFINTSGKPLNSSVKELTERLIKFFEKYGNIPFNKIEKAILKYTEEVITGKIKYAQRILFFIWINFLSFISSSK